MATSVMIIIPSINGAIERITIGIDSSLPDDKKLPIAMSQAGVETIGLIRQSTAAWAMGQFTDATAKALFVNGVLGIIDTGLVCKVGQIADGD